MKKPTYVEVPGRKLTNSPWASTGIAQKPSQCKICKYSQIGAGFVPDYVGKNAKVALCFACPNSDDIVGQRPLSGKKGWWTFKTFIAPYFGWDEVVMVNLVRCKPPTGKGGKVSYPTGATRASAEKTCRYYDGSHMEEGQMKFGGVKNFDPNFFIATFDPDECRVTPAYTRLILADVGKARRMVERGFRPMVLFGIEAAELFGPHIHNNGGLKMWRGDGWEGEYKFRVAKEGPFLVV